MVFVRYLAIAAIVFAALGASFPLTFAQLGAQDQHLVVPAAIPCPTYQTNLLVDLIDSTPTTVDVGTRVVTRVHVVYPDGTPATLLPEMMSFRWSNDGQEKVFINVPVTPTGDPGFYTYTQIVRDDFPTGKVTISALTCSCSDSSGNYGPTDDISSDVTLTPSDNSHVDIGPAPPPKPPPSPTLDQLLAMYGVPIVIGALIIIAIALLVARSRKKS
jgi:hypothetical protein